MQSILRATQKICSLAHMAERAIMGYLTKSKDEDCGLKC